MKDKKRAIKRKLKLQKEAFCDEMWVEKEPHRLHKKHAFCNSAKCCGSRLKEKGWRKKRRKEELDAAQ